METHMPRVNHHLGFPFYPTYEEWKQMERTKESRLIEDFLSYLWGMETEKTNRGALGVFPFYPTYEEWKLW